MPWGRKTEERVDWRSKLKDVAVFVMEPTSSMTSAKTP
jgi:hypothetical protein